MSAALAEAFAGVATSMAMCWRLTRGDGLVLGFTSHDRDILLEGLLYRSNPGMTPSAVSQTAALRADSMDVEGALVTSAVSAFDLESGRWAGARVELFACDWRQPELGKMRIISGEIGDVSRPIAQTGGSFRVELLSDMARLERAGPLRLAPMCRSELGDGKCGVDMEGRRTELRVAAVAEERIDLVQPLQRPELYAGGRMRFVSGILCGLDRRVASAGGQALWLEEGVPAGSVAGSHIWLWEGCDRRIATCAERFGNSLAFGGEPHVPGTDALLRYAEG